MKFYFIVHNSFLRKNTEEIVLGKNKNQNTQMNAFTNQVKDEKCVSRHYCKINADMMVRPLHCLGV